MNRRKREYNRSPVAAEAERVVLLPGGPAGGVVVVVALAKTTVLMKVLVESTVTQL